MVRKYSIKVLQISFLSNLFFICAINGFAGYSDQDLSVYLDRIKPQIKPSKVIYSQYLDEAADYLRDDLLPEAKSKVWNAIRLFPDDPDAYINLAIIHIAEGNLESAKRILKQAGGLAPVDYYQEEILLYNVGLVSYKSGEFEDAVEYFSQALSVYPDFAEAYLYLGESYNKLGQKTNAFINIFQARFIFEQQNKHLLKRKAQGILHDLSQHSKVDSAALSQIFFEKGKLALSENNLEKAAYFLEECIYLNPQFIEVYYQLALLYSRQNAPHNSIAYLNRIIEVAPDDTRAYISIAYAYRDINKYDESLKYLKKALELEPDNFIILFDIGTVYSAQGKDNTARKTLSLARKKAVEQKNLFLIEKIDKALKQMEKKEEVHTRPLRVKKRVLPKESKGSLYPYHSISGNRGSFNDGYFTPDPKPKLDHEESKSRVLMQEY